MDTPYGELTDEQRRVAAGAAWLDAVEDNGWDEIVDLDTFNLREPCGCVLGQIVKQYNPDVDYYALDGATPDSMERKVHQALDFGYARLVMPHEMACALGFHGWQEGSNDEVANEWDALQNAWRELILKRRRRSV